MSRPADRERWLALALLAAALGLAYLLLLHPWWTVPMLEAQDRIETLRERELRVRTQLQQAPDVQRLLAMARAQQDSASGFLPEATAELATAGLVQRLETVVAQASPGNVACAITNRAPINRASPEPGYAQVAVQVRLQCGMPELASVLHSLEGGAPRLFVEDFNLLPIRRFVLGANRAQGSGGVDASFSLVGYLRPAVPVVAAAAAGAGEATMRLDDAGPRTWLLGATAAWALAAWLLALGGMGGRIAPLDADAALLQPLPEPAPTVPERLGPLADYSRISARPLVSPNRRPQPFSLQPESESARPEERFEYLLTGVLMSPSLQMAIVQPAGGGEPERIRVGQGPEAAPSWRLVALSPRAAVFEGPEGEQSLALRSYDGGTDLRTSARPRPAPRRGRAAPARQPEAIPVPATEVQAEGADDGSAPPAEPDAVQEADAPGTPQEQMEAIRKRIEARREQLRREAQGAPPPQQR